MTEQSEFSLFPLCVTDSVRDLMRLTGEMKMQDDLKALQRKKAAKVATKLLMKSPLSSMRHKMWLEHRERVKNAISKLDAEPPALHAARLTGVNTLRDDANVFMRRTKENIQLLVEISRTMRTHGVVKPFRYDQIHVVSAVPMAIANLERLERENSELGKRILETRSEVDSGLSPNSRRGALTDRLKTKKSLPFILNKETLAKYEVFNLKLPPTDAECKRLFRPRIFFDIYLKDARPLGRIVIQLYTEAAPLVVLQLVRSAMCSQHNEFLIRRLFPNLWVEADLKLSQNSPLHNPLEFDAKIIDHGACNNVLSFDKIYCKTGFPDSLAFTISFKPLIVCNGKRVGFGRIIKGSKICECIQSYGTKNGKLSRGILFTSCGLL